MSYLDAIIYGVIQGFAEFLPVSSSGHLALLPYLRGIEDPGVAFDLAMHVGTAFAVVVYFHHEVRDLIRSSFMVLRALIKKERIDAHWYTINYLVATVATVIIVVLVKDFASSWGRNSGLIAFNLFFFGILMFIADRFFKESDGFKERKILLSILVGVFQAIAVFPGVSRSGVTLTISRFFKISRKDAAGFSFLLSLPIIIGGFLLKLPEFISNPSIQVGQAGLGMLISFVVGILTIHFFIKLVSRIGLGFFAFYRVILALIIVYLIWV